MFPLCFHLNIEYSTEISLKNTLLTCKAPNMYIVKEKKLTIKQHIYFKTTSPSQPLKMCSNCTITQKTMFPLCFHLRGCEPVIGLEPSGLASNPVKTRSRVKLLLFKQTRAILTKTPRCVTARPFGQDRRLEKRDSLDHCPLETLYSLQLFNRGLLCIIP